jgi:hypothetical protein
MKTTVRVLSLSLGTLLLAAAPALARISSNHNETLVRDRSRQPKPR